MIRKWRLAGVLICAAQIAAPAGAYAGQAPLPPAENIDDAKERLRFLSAEEGRIETWLEENWEKEFRLRHPLLSLDPRGRDETEKKYREREMRNRMAISDLKAGLRGERKKWLASERRALLGREIPEEIPVRLGPYDADRGEFPLLLGFGWPAGLSVRYKVPEGRKAGFAREFPKSLPGMFRINEKGEVFLESLGKGGIREESLVHLLPQGPRLLWQGSHDSWVTAVAFSPDGAKIVSGGGDGALIAWDAESGHRLFHLAGVEMALSVAFSPDGTTLVTGGTDSGLRMRDAATGREIWREIAAGMIFAVDFSPDGRYVATGDDGGSVRIWNAQTGKEIQRVDLGSSVRSLSFLSGGKTLVAGGEGKFVVLWDMASFRQVWRKEIGWPIFAVSANRSGKHVAVAGDGNSLQVLQENDGSPAWSVKGDGELRALGFDPSGRLVGCGGAGYTVRIFLAEKGELLWTAAVGSPVRSLAFGPTGRNLAVGSADFGVRLFEVDEGGRITAAFWKHGRIFMDRGRVAELFRR